MDVDYQKVIDLIVGAGKRILPKAGNINDIGITKINLTEEDIRIERDLKELVQTFGSEHIIYAEEENNVFEKSKNLWVIDPISGTHNFIEGLPHYAIVVSHVKDHNIVFACVYDPSVDELFTVWKNKGAFKNGKIINVSKNTNRKVILRPSSQWKNPEIISNVQDELKSFFVENNRYSMAVNYCLVACGEFDGIVSFTKDSFPEFAGSLFIEEAGGVFTNGEGRPISSEDRIFVGGNNETQKILLDIIKNNVK